MTLDEAIKRYANNAEYERTHGNLQGCLDFKQLAEWLRELKAHREIHDVLLQLLVDLDLNICCDDLSYDEEEDRICKENCDFKTKSCWVRWAKMKAREKGKVADVIKDTPTFDQRVLSTPCKPESEDTMKEQESKIILIPKNATKGEVLKLVFPQLETKGGGAFITFTLDGIVGSTVERMWWDSPYKVESEE